MKTRGAVVGVNGNVITVRFEGPIMQNEVAHVLLERGRLKAEVVRVQGDRADLQVFEDTKGLRQSDPVEFTGELLSVQLGPGLLGQVYDGLQNPLKAISDVHGFFLPRGTAFPALDPERKWEFTPMLNAGDRVRAGSPVGFVSEGVFRHSIFVPFDFSGRGRVLKTSPSGLYTLNQPVCTVENGEGHSQEVALGFRWPIKRPVTCYREKLPVRTPLLTRIRLIDTLFPVARGGTFAIPGPFGAGKTVLQQITSRNARVDIVIIAACGERAGEVVETIREFPKLKDPFTGRFLMERTIIICNTSSMPVAAREASVYTAVTLGEYYRQMGLHVLLLADSTSRWAQAMRERSSRMEEIPGEEAFPAYLESVIAAFYERAGEVRLAQGGTGSLTIGGSVSPAGGSFDEPVTQATLKVVGAFHGLSRDRSEARKYPAIDPLESWTRYPGFIDLSFREAVLRVLRHGHEIEQMMKVVGEEGTPLEDYVIFLKAELLDRVYLQQNAFDAVDAATSEERQRHVFCLLHMILGSVFVFADKDEARQCFDRLRLLFLDYNGAEWQSLEFQEMETRIVERVLEAVQPSDSDMAESFREILRDHDVESSFHRSRFALTGTSVAASGPREEMHVQDLQQGQPDRG